MGEKVKPEISEEALKAYIPEEEAKEDGKD